MDNYILLGYCKLELVVHRAAKFFFRRLLRQVMQFKLALNYIVCVGLELTVPASTSGLFALTYFSKKFQIIRH